MKATLLSVVGVVVLTVAFAGRSSARESALAGKGATKASSPGLYVFDASSGALKLLIPGAHEREDVSWAPDGRWIASSDTADFLVDVIQPDGRGLRDVNSVLWSPSGSEVAYGTDNGLFVGSSVDGASVRVADDGATDPIDWSADGSQLIFGRDRSSSCCWPSFGVVHGDGTQARTLWTAPATDGHDSWIDNAAFSPSGGQIAVGATINNAAESANGGEFIYLADPAQAGATRLTTSPSGLEFSTWSADGNWLILESDDSLFRVRASGGQAEPLCPETCHQGELSPDRRQVVYSTRRSKSSVTIWIANIDGSETKRLANVPQSTYFVWSPDGRSLGLTIPKDRRHSAVALLNIATRKIRRLTNGSKTDFVAEVSHVGHLVAFARAHPASLWVINAEGGPARKVMTLATGPLGPCAFATWSPTAPTLAVANEACAPS